MEVRSAADRPARADAADATHAENAGPEADAVARVSVSPWSGRLALASLGAALVPVISAAVRAVATGWVPVGDSALIAVRSRDVLGGGPGGDVPLLGMWASASWEVGFDLNHPGPLLFDVLALPAWLIGGGAGLVIGAALVGAASVVGIFLAARRVGGPALATAAMAVTALLCLAMGSEVLIEPWHAGTVLLPFLCCAALVWATLAGDALCLPWAVLAGSLVLSSNLGYTLLVPPLLLVGVAAVAVAAWRERGERRRRPAVALGAALVVAALCWAQPLIEQVTADEGNLSRLRRSQSVERDTLGWGAATRSVAEVAGLPPWWLPPSYADDFHLSAFGNDLPGTVPAVLGLAATAALVAVAGRSGWRRRDRTVVAAAAVAGLLLVAAVATANMTPSSPYGTIAYQLRWLWPLAAFVTLALLVALVRRWPPHPDHSWWPVAALAGVAAVAAVAALPAANNGSTAPAATYAVARDLVGDVGDADLPGTVEVQCGEGVFDPYCEAVMAKLQDRGTGFVVDDSLGARQLGQGRRARGGEPRLIVVAGDYAAFTPEGAEVVTRHLGLTRDDQRELFFLREGLKEALAAGDIRLSGAGERAAARGDLPSVAPARDGWRIDPDTALELRPWLYGVERRDLVAMVHNGLLDVDPAGRERLDRYAELQDRWDETTVAVFLEPAASSSR